VFIDGFAIYSYRRTQRDGSHQNKLFCACLYNPAGFFLYTMDHVLLLYGIFIYFLILYVLLLLPIFSYISIPHRPQNYYENRRIASLRPSDRMEQLAIPWANVCEILH
jgi:hypothetical protein